MSPPAFTVKLLLLITGPKAALPTDMASILSPARNANVLIFAPPTNLIEPTVAVTSPVVILPPALTNKAGAAAVSALAATTAPFAENIPVLAETKRPVLTGPVICTLPPSRTGAALNTGAGSNVTGLISANMLASAI